jgi:hypothetical protein
VTALAWDNVWAVGRSASADGPALILHRSGTHWSLVPSPPSPVAGTSVGLLAVSAVSASDIWAVGRHGYGGSSATYRPLMQHWDGSKWSIVRSPIADAVAGGLADVTMRRSGWGWSVGRDGGGAGVILRQCPA